MGRGSSDKATLTLRLTQRQLEALDALDELYGNNRGEKARHILVDWLGRRPELAPPRKR